MPRPVQDAFDRFSSAQRDRRRADASTPAQDRAVWQAIIGVLEAYRSEENGARLGKFVEPMPAEIVIIVEGTLREILAGHMPENFKSFFGKGAPSTHPAEEIDQRNAVLYLSAARARIIDDRTPGKTIREAFCVAASTYRRWVKLYPTDAKEWHPEWGSQRPELIRDRMIKSARRYLERGRRQGSILARARKRLEHPPSASTATGPGAAQSDAKINTHDEAKRVEALIKRVRDKWTGPVVSILDGKLYETSSKYLEHLIQARVRPVG